MNFVLIGDSQAVGLLPHLVPRMQARGYALIGSAGHVGWSTARFVEAQPAEAFSRLRPDLVLVVLGGNDTASATLIARIRELVAQIRRHSSPRIVWIGPAHSTVPDVERRKRGVRAVQRALLPMLGVEWLDGGVMTYDLQHAPDGVHFVRGSLATWAERIDVALREGSRGVRWVGRAAVAATLVTIAGLAWFSRG